MFVIYISIIFITGFFIVSGYYNEKSIYDQLSAEKLHSISASIAMQVDGDCLEKVLKENEFTDDIKSTTEDTCFHNIHLILKKAKEVNKYNENIYTLIYNEDEGVFQYGVSSDWSEPWAVVNDNDTTFSINYRHRYELYPEVLKTNYETGGVIERYSTENGEWISAFYPIKNSNEKTVSIIQVDINLLKHDEIIWDHYSNQAIISLIVILLTSIILIIYAKKILKEDEETKQELYKQKIEIETKNRDLTDSINYAKKIQLAILPDQEYIEKSLPNSFIFYRPKDIVSGDFYWCRSVENTILIACVDCTGHGIPGALMSMIGNSVLNEIINNNTNLDPGSILDQLEKGVNEALSTKDYESQSKDGMDISLCCIEKDNQIMHFAGALRPLIIINKEGMKEIKGNRFPIGGGETYKKGNFKSHTFKIKKGDKFYMYSDGYPDQFGGEKSKKFMNKNFKNLLIKNHQLSSIEQYNALSNELTKWQGKLEQIDDILIIGILF